MAKRKISTKNNLFPIEIESVENVLEEANADIIGISENVLREADNLPEVISNEEEMDQAKLILGQLKDSSKEVRGARLSDSKPLRDLTKKIFSWFEVTEQKLKDSTAQIEEKINIYVSDVLKSHEQNLTNTVSVSEGSLKWVVDGYDPEGLDVEALRPYFSKSDITRALNKHLKDTGETNQIRGAAYRQVVDFSKSDPKVSRAGRVSAYPSKDTPDNKSGVSNKVVFGEYPEKFFKIEEYTSSPTYINSQFQKKNRDLRDIRKQNRINGKPLNFGSPQTYEELELLRKMFSEGKIIEDLAQYFQRSPKSIIKNLEEPTNLTGESFPDDDDAKKYSGKLVVLANSRKMTGRCVAVKEVGGGSWVRPISSRPSGEVSEKERRFKNGEDPRVMDIVDIPLLSEKPSDYQQENYLFDLKIEWEKVGRVSWPELGSYADDAEILWRNGRHTKLGRNDEIKLEDALSLTSSLCLIRVDKVILVVTSAGSGRTRLQAKFWHNDIEYRLWVTDPRYERSYMKKGQGEHQLGESFLTISLGEPFKDHVYKLVAAIIEKAGNH